ncbi:hypothetical protein NQ315_015772 [Exocentrus adspersus]|uniref:ubiquitinyl hydrolase 1 n=1 Tax=Exocentrus adspersus TaxID=1586481 RepID=A0AAV8W478_9CUCU|nr:hypothetical protein NQ315_015772 [Exocentrus adspersus]
MNSKDSEYGILAQNVLLKEIPKGGQRTALLGQIVRIEDKLKDGNYVLRFLTEINTWELNRFSCSQENVVCIPEKLWLYIASIQSPQERIKLAKNKALCEKLKSVGKDMVVGFMDTNDVYLGRVRYMGPVKGMGYCFGIELHEKKINNNCNGSCANIPYFSCTPGYGVFTSIERVRPLNYPSVGNDAPGTKQVSEIDDYLDRRISSIMNNDPKPHHEEIVTKYGEYPRKQTQSMPPKNSRNSRSLQNILDVDSRSINTNNDFDQNTVIQPDKTHLMPEGEKIKNKDIDLIDVIGTWSGSSDSAQLQQFSNLKKGLDKNDNIKEKYVHVENNTLGRRNKSINPLSHFLDGNNTMRKSKFYTNEVAEMNFKEHTKTLTKKQENSKKINEKSEQLAKTSTSTFYVNDKPKYHDPQPGTTNDLVVGSLVEVLNDVSRYPLYGVVRWMGVDNETNFILVGVELEEEQSQLPLTLTDGTHNGERFFSCASNRALFVPLEQCHKDSRFQDGAPTPVHQATAAAAAPDQIDCPVIPGAVAPLCMPTEEDVEAVCGKYRGIQGHHNSCYLDVTLFSMFTYTAVFDSLLFRPKNVDDIDDYEEVQRVLREEIVNPLRKNLFVSADHVMKLRRLLDRLSSVSGLTSEEKDPEEFLNSLLAQILKAEPFLKLNSGQEAFHYQLFVEKDADLTLPSVQQLFEQSFLTSNIKLKEVPSCLIIQMPRFGKSYKMYPRILPSQLLDVTDIIEGSPRQCIVCGTLARYECRECFDDYSNAGLESTAFCVECLKTAHHHERRKHHRPVRLEVAQDFSMMQDAYKPPRLFMELFAVICIETSHYVAFVKCGVGHEAPWCFFDSMADRKGEKNGYNIPEMVACPDVSRWLSDDRICRQLHEEFPLDRHLPEHARRLLCDAYICMYQSSDVMMYR